MTQEQATAEPTTYQRVKSDWNQMTRVEQIQARHQLWSETPLPDSEYAASWADIEVLLSEVAQLREACKKALTCATLNGDVRALIEAAALKKGVK
jgi:hypothetical protein